MQPLSASVKTGITAGPIWGKPQMDAAQQNYTAQAAKPLDTSNVFGVPLSAEQRSQMGQNYGQQAQALAAPAATDFARAAGLANAKHQLASEQARAQSGINWGNIGQSLYNTGLYNQLAGQSRDIRGQMADQNRALSLFNAIFNGIPGLLS